MQVLLTCRLQQFRESFYIQNAMISLKSIYSVNGAVICIHEFLPEDYIPMYSCISGNSHSTLSISLEGYFRNALCVLNVISTFFINSKIFLNVIIFYELFRFIILQITIAKQHERKSERINNLFFSEEGTNLKRCIE